MDILGVVANDTTLCVPLSTCCTDTTSMLDSAVRWVGTRIVIENVAFSPGYHHRISPCISFLPPLHLLGVPWLSFPAAYLIPARERTPSKAWLKLRAGHILH